MRRFLSSTTMLMVGSLWLVVAGCNKPATDATAERPSATAEAAEASPAAQSVMGTIEGREVDLIHADFSGQLALYEKDSWGSSPSILIFLFLGEDELPDGKTFAFKADDDWVAKTPHFHCRYPKAENRNDLETKIYSGKYDLMLTFGQRADGKLSGTIAFSVPDTETSVKGAFTVAVK